MLLLTNARRQRGAKAADFDDRIFWRRTERLGINREHLVPKLVARLSLRDRDVLSVPFRRHSKAAGGEFLKWSDQNWRALTDDYFGFRDIRTMDRIGRE